MTVALHDWGRRLGDALRTALERADLDAARRLAVEGDGQARSLAKEYTFMSRGLGITINVLLELLDDTAARGSEDARVALAGLARRLRADLGAFGGGAAASGAGDTAGEELSLVAGALNETLCAFEREQARLAEEIVRAIDRADIAGARALLDEKESGRYLPLHDVLLRFMADAFAWVLEWFGPDELLRFHLATAEAQRPGFEKWEQLPAEEFARTTAFLLKQHMGHVTVTEDEEKFTIEQTPCGSGGRLRLAGAYSGPHPLPFVDTPGPLTFGAPRLPVYCTHCAIWNGTATLGWFGRAQWVFDRPSREDGSCTLHIYKQPGYTPSGYVQRVAVPRGRS